MTLVEHGHRPNTRRRLTVGIMYVAPGRQYPLHHHSPHELYLTIAGQADWRFGGNDDLRPIGPDTVIYNRRGDLHF